MRILVACLLGVASVRGQFGSKGLSVGDSVASGTITLDYDFPPSKIDLAKRIAGKNVIVLSLPGAFTPTWSDVQIPGYLEELDNLKALGVDEVIITAVNDAAVMRAWATDQKCDDVDGQLTLMGDPRGELVKAFGIELTHAGPIGKGLISRGKRTAIYIEAGIVKVIRIAEAPDDPAGDDRPDVTLAGAMKEAIMESKHAEL